MPKGSIELTEKRKDEIISACEKLYQTMSFKDITLKEIANIAGCTRTLIYHYFQTKEEIFLCLNKKEYELWQEDLEKIIETHNSMTNEEIADVIALSLQKREQMLKLMCMNHFDMEENSRIEILTEFKTAFGSSMKTVRKLLNKFCKNMSKKDIEDFLYSFFPFVYGIYPYAVVKDNQKEAMQKAQAGFIYHDIYELANVCVKKLLK